MGYWVNTVYVNHAAADDVGRAIEKLFAAEGMERVALAARSRLSVEPMQYDLARNNDIWGVAVFPGAAGWTAIHTAPLELFAEPLIGSDRRRISTLCCELKSSAILVNVYDSSGVIVAECSADGEVFIRGYNGQGGPEHPYRAHCDAATEETYRLQLGVHAWLGLHLQEVWGEEVSRLFAERCAGTNRKYCDNLVSVDTLICRKPFDAPGGMALHFKWTGASRQRFEPCASWEEYRAAVKSRDGV
jgi:hypothetical protein